jgi:ankyrin repeat protein
MQPKSDDWDEREQLHFAAQKGDLAAVDELLATKHDVNAFDTIGKTPLHHAVGAGHLRVVTRSLEVGANVDAHDERWIGNTPLSDNVDQMSFEMARQLMDAGADPTIRGWMQLSALDRAADRTDTEGKKVLKLLQDAAKSRRA